MVTKFTSYGLEKPRLHEDCIITIGFYSPVALHLMGPHGCQHLSRVVGTNFQTLLRHKKKSTFAYNLHPFTKWSVVT